MPAPEPEHERAHWGRHRSLLRRALGRAHRPTWHDRHPLPAGWRPRTRVDVHGRLVEPWGWLVTDHTGWSHDAGEWWLEQGMDPDQAAHEILQRWLRLRSDYLAPHELPGICLSVRRAGYDGGRVGVARVEPAVLLG